jgi:hypothetical protein
MHEPDGGIQYLVGCYGALTPMSVCYKKADELCPGGYTITDQTADVVGSVTAQGTGVQNLARQLAIKCNGPADGADG